MSQDTPHQSHNHLLEKEKTLEDTLRLPFRYIGHYSSEKVYILPIYSEFLAKELVRVLNQALPTHAQEVSRILCAEQQESDENAGYHITRWVVALPAEAVDDAFLAAVEKNDFLRIELAMRIVTLTERYYDVINTAVTATACQNAYESEIRRIKSAQRVRPTISTENREEAEQVHNASLLENIR